MSLWTRPREVVIDSFTVEVTGDAADSPALILELNLSRARTWRETLIENLAVCDRVIADCEAERVRRNAGV